MSTLSSANVTDVNLVLKERTHKIKIKYSMHQYSILVNILGNWLMTSIAVRAYTTTQRCDWLPVFLLFE